MTRRPHQAWVVAAVTFVTLLGAAGFRSAPSVLELPLQHDLHLSRESISLAVAVNVILFGLVGPFAAALTGSRRLGGEATALWPTIGDLEV